MKMTLEIQSTKYERSKATFITVKSLLLQNPILKISFTTIAFKVFTNKLLFWFLIHILDTSGLFFPKVISVLWMYFFSINMIYLKLEWSILFLKQTPTYNPNTWTVTILSHIFTLTRITLHLKYESLQSICSTHQTTIVWVTYTVIIEISRPRMHCHCRAVESYDNVPSNDINMVKNFVCWV